MKIMDRTYINTKIPMVIVIRSCVSVNVLLLCFIKSVMFMQLLSPILQLSSNAYLP